MIDVTTLIRFTFKVNFFFKEKKVIKGFPGSSDGKESAYHAGDVGLIPGSGSSPGEGNGRHSSILAWKIPWTEETGGLERVGQGLARSWTRLSD